MQDHTWRPRLALVVLTPGIAVSAWLVWIHLTLLSDPDAGSACNLGGYFNCDIVNGSRYASVLGVPIAYGGFSLYAVLASLAALEVLGNNPPRFVVYARFLGTPAALYSVYLALLSTFVLQALCVFCLGLYLVNTGLVFLAWYGPPPRLRVFDILRADLRLLRSPQAWLVHGGLAVLSLGALALGLHATRTVSKSVKVTVPIQSLLLSVAPGHDEGPSDADIVVVEFSDFECPHCRRVSADFAALRSEFAGRVRFVFKHYPLDQSCNKAVRHSHRGRRSCLAADAAICAGDQGRLWPFQAEVFARGVDEDALIQAAVATNIEVSLWQQCRWTERARDFVETDVNDGVRAGITKTPTFLVGDKLITGSAALDEVRTEISRLSSGR